MKKIIPGLVIVFLSFILKSQQKNETQYIGSCSKYIETTVDKMTWSKSTHSKKQIIVSTNGGIEGFGIWLQLGESKDLDLIFSIHVIGAGPCIDKGDKINILFTDDSRIELVNYLEFNCKKTSTVYFSDVFGNLSKLNELRTKKIKAMRVWTKDIYLQKDFTKENSDNFYNIINCLVPLDLIKNEIIEPSSDLKTASLDPEVFLVVEENAEFPGGLAAMGKYMRDNMQYPAMAREAGISGKCFLKFVVNETGEISNIEVLQGIPRCPDCDKEAIRVAKSMPKWKPAKIKGRSVKCYFNLPFSFKIQ